MQSWSDEMNQMLSAFDCQAKFSLANINTALKSSGLSLNAEFRQYFLQASNDRLVNTLGHFYAFLIKS